MASNHLPTTSRAINLPQFTWGMIRHIRTKGMSSEKCNDSRFELDTDQKVFTKECKIMHQFIDVSAGWYEFSLFALLICHLHTLTLHSYCPHLLCSVYLFTLGGLFLCIQTQNWLVEEDQLYWSHVMSLRVALAGSSVNSVFFCQKEKKTTDCISSDKEIKMHIVIITQHCRKGSKISKQA